MQPITNTFYIGKFADDIGFRNGYTLDSAGAEAQKNGCSTSGFTGITKGYPLYISDYFISSMSMSVYYYDKSKVFISKVTVATDGEPVLILPPANAEYIRLSYTNPPVDVTLQPWLQKNYGINAVMSLMEVTAHYKSLNRVRSRDDDNRYFRTTLDGTLAIFGRDADYIIQGDISDRYLLVITRLGDNGQESIYFRGNFAKTDCQFDANRHKVTIKVNAEDDYTDVLAGQDTTYDLMKLAPAMTQIKLYQRAIVQYFFSGGSSLTNIYGGMHWEEDVSADSINANDMQNKYHFKRLWTANEITISSLPPAAYNGVYIGQNGTWKNNQGYTLYLVKIKYYDKGPQKYPYWEVALHLKNPFGIDIFTSKEHYQANPDDMSFETGRDESFIFWTLGRKDIVMQSVTGSAGDLSQMQFVIKCEGDNPDILSYNIYCRLLAASPDLIQIGSTPAYDIAEDDPFVDSIRNYKKCLPLAYGNFIFSAQTVTYPTPFGVNDTGNYFTDNIYDAASGIDHLIPICQAGWGNSAIFMAYDNLTEIEDYEISARYKIMLRNAYHISECIRVLLKKIAPGLKHEGTEEYSHFLYGNANPIYGSKFDVYITPITNILVSQYDEPAKKGELTFKQLMDMLQNCFQCYWFIDKGKFKIEHISYFLNGGSYTRVTGVRLDLETLKDRFNGKQEDYYQNSYEYDKDNLSGTYQFSWMNDVSDGFGGLKIKIKEQYIKEDSSEDIQINMFTSDIDLMMLQPDDFSKDGFALLLTQNNEIPFKRMTLKNDADDPDNARTYHVYMQNYMASWPYLINFWMRSLPGIMLEYNRLPAGTLHASGTKLAMKQNVKIPIESGIDINRPVHTVLGNGMIKSCSEDIDTNHATLSLVYPVK